MKKLLTIVVPSYNMERYLDKCLSSLGIDNLRSLPSATYENYAQALEVLVINDGSKDKTSEIAHKFEKQYPEVIKVVDKVNGHYGSCINTGLSLATGEYFKILEADDTYNTIGFVQFLDYLERMGAMKKIDIFLSSMSTVNEKGDILTSSVHTLEENVIYPIHKLIETRGCIFNAGLTYRTSLLKEIGYKQTEKICYSDTDYFLIPLAYARCFVCFKGLVYQYLKGREDQSTNNIQYAKNTEMVKTITFNLLKKLPELEKAADPTIAKYIYKMLGDCLIYVYRIAILGPARKYVKVDLRQLDSELKSLSPQMWKNFGEIRYSNKIRYRYVKAWREGDWKLCFMGWVCCAYSQLVKKMRL